nr:MAG TPA: hypothetical protein [Caudoviricetes sp.]
MVDIVQNRNDQNSNRQYYHEFFICTHKYSPFRKTRNGYATPTSCLGKYTIAAVR